MGVCWTKMARQHLWHPSSTSGIDDEDADSGPFSHANNCNSCKGALQSRMNECKPLQFFLQLARRKRKLEDFQLLER
nr:hypothetical protein HmN_001004400 [Hymenolepis microstoma]